MPINKNAIVRYKILDELLGSRYHNYSLDDLTEEVNIRLAEMYRVGDNVVRRTIEKDIHFLEYDPFYAEIDRYTVDSYNPNTQQTFKKRCLRYADPSYSIFKKELNLEERYLLKEVFSLLGQFDGLPDLEGLERQRLSLNTPANKEPIISLSKNPIEDSTFWGELFTCISQHVVTEIHYHTFKEPNRDRIYTLYPYLLKYYNGRWYLFGQRVENEKMKCFPLDRIDSIAPLPSVNYKEYDGKLNEIFEDVIGVSIFEDEPVRKILFWVSDYSVDYVMTKPLHESQCTLNKATTDELRQKYSSLKGGRFFRIECRKNYELIRELCSFGKALLVLEPTCIQEEIVNRTKEMNEEYSKLIRKMSWEDTQKE